MVTTRVPADRVLAASPATAAPLGRAGGLSVARIAVMNGFADRTIAASWMQPERAAPVAIGLAPDAAAKRRRLPLAVHDPFDRTLAVRVPGLARNLA
jgi:hypothetical protein